MQLRDNAPGGPIETAWERHRFDMKLVNPANKRKYEVIVVGTGLAGQSPICGQAFDQSVLQRPPVPPLG